MWVPRLYHTIEQFDLKDRNLIGLFGLVFAFRSHVPCTPLTTLLDRSNWSDTTWSNFPSPPHLLFGSCQCMVWAYRLSNEWNASVCGVGSTRLGCDSGFVRLLSLSCLLLCQLELPSSCRFEYTNNRTVFVRLCDVMSYQLYTRVDMMDAELMGLSCLVRVSCDVMWCQNQINYIILDSIRFERWNALIGFDCLSLVITVYHWSIICSMLNVFVFDP